MELQLTCLKVSLMSLWCVWNTASSRSLTNSQKPRTSWICGRGSMDESWPVTTSSWPSSHKEVAAHASTSIWRGRNGKANRCWCMLIARIDSHTLVSWSTNFDRRSWWSKGYALEMMAWCMQLHGATAAQGSTSAPSSSTPTFLAKGLIIFHCWRSKFF